MENERRAKCISHKNETTVRQKEKKHLEGMKNKVKERKRCGSSDKSQESKPKTYLKTRTGSKPM